MDQKIPLPLDTDVPDLNSAKGKSYWRSFDEWTQSDAFLEKCQREQPQLVSFLSQGMNRRKFLQLMGASIALSGISGCMTGPPQEQILPYVRQPEEITQGVPLDYATAMSFGGYGCGLIVKSHMGRPTKIEGNPDVSAVPSEQPDGVKYGPSDVFSQASLLGMYDPDRSQTVKHISEISTWENFTNALAQKLREHAEEVAAARRDNQPEPIFAILTETFTSPTLAQQLRTILNERPDRNRFNIRWYLHDALDQVNARKGVEAALGAGAEVHYDLTNADFILSLEADFLVNGPGQLSYTRQFTDRRRGRSETDRANMNRLYVVESTPTLTGTKADHRLALRPSEIESFLKVLATRLQVSGVESTELPESIPTAWMDALVEDLGAESHRGKSAILVGEGQPPYVHALALKINDTLGNIRNENTPRDRGTVIVTEPIAYRGHDLPEAKRPGSLRDLTRHIEIGMSPSAREEGEDANGQVKMLLMLGGNPAYTAPKDLLFSDKMQEVPWRTDLSLYEDETSARCHWHIPESHYLESWGDVRTFDGTVLLTQPLIAPLYNGKAVSEVLALLTGHEERSSHEILRAYWRCLYDGNHAWRDAVRRQWSRARVNAPSSFDDFWQTCLHNGMIRNTRANSRTVSVQDNWQNAPVNHVAGESGLQVIFRPDPTVYDGRFANNGWLQELPKPLSKVTWENVAWISPATAVSLGLAAQNNPQQANGKLVSLTYSERRLEVPVWVMPGQADNTVTLFLGYGRTRAGQVGSNIGYNAYDVRKSDRLWYDGGLTVSDSGQTQPIASTQHHFLMENRHLIRESAARNEDYDHLVEEMHAHQHELLTLYPPAENQTERQWGMAIDLTSCTGCNACMIACQSENNIPVVGKEEVSNGREMHWIRMDTYYTGEPYQSHDVQAYHQPVPCMQCENAPCELVCPVEATVHSDDGLNDMVYNRCVGTRYCSNNCPYKVRRFNFLQYADFDTESLRLMYNPDVTVRSRGVMEKCTYCVQRIRTSEIAATRDGRQLVDGDIQTACQSACPAGAIVFGDVNQGKINEDDPKSKVVERKEEPTNYTLLTELGARPRTSYLAALKNPNPRLVSEESDEH